MNDTLAVRLVPFWRTAGNKDYFDGWVVAPVAHETRADGLEERVSIRAAHLRFIADAHTRVESSSNHTRGTTNDADVDPPAWSL